jgi:hypothetical protein
MASGTDVEGLSGECVMTGFPVKQLGIGLRQRSIQELSAKGESVAAVAVGEEAEVADLGKAVGKNVQEEAADELPGVESHGSGAVVFFAVPPLEGHLCILKRQQAVVGNGDAVGIAAEVIEDLGGSPEGRFGIDDPLMLSISAQEPGKGLGISQGGKI